MGDLLIPNTSNHNVVSYSIVIENKKLDPSYQVLSLMINNEINRIPLAKIVFRDGDASARAFEISDKEDFNPGKRIKIKIGLDGSNQQVFEGIIVKQTVKVKENGNGELHVECRHNAIKMAIGRQSHYYESLKDSTLFENLVSKYEGLKCDAKTTNFQHKELVQHDVTDWDFMLLRAEANAMLVNIDADTVKIANPDTSADPVLQVTYGSSILEFEAEIDARTQWKNVKATSWNYTNQEVTSVETSEAPLFDQQGNLSGSDLAETINLDAYALRHSGHIPEEELQNWADGVMLRSRLSKIRGRAKITGFASVKPADLMLLQGVGDRYNGKTFVTSVTHEIGSGQWDTHIQFGLDAEQYAQVFKDVSDLPAAGLTGAIHGLQVGVVVKLEYDPEGEDRIRVRMPLIDNNDDGIWTRIACLDAGNNRGSFFRPEIGDEVIVGFINADPSDAIMLGMLNSSAKPAPIIASDANNKKGFTTRSAMHLQFNDDTKTITIDTPAGNSVIIDEEDMKIEIKDQNNNKIVMNATGIKIQSPMNVEIAAGANLTLSAAASLSIGGAILGVKADGSLSMEGATAKLASQGITEINGSLVKIN